MQITDSLFVSYSQCTYKAFLKFKGEVGEVVDYEAIQTEADVRFREAAIERLLRSHTESQVVRDPPSLQLAVKEGVKLIVGATVEALGVALRFDLLELLVNRDDDRRVVCVPVQFSHRNRLTREDSLLAAFYGIILAEALGQPVPFVKVVHGSDFSVSKIKLVAPTGTTRLVKEARQILDRLRKQIESASAPLMILNSHCTSCEFRDRCHAEAVNRDDLSLMRGMSEKEVLAQRKRGINTVTQFACTFRPKSVGTKRKKPLKRHLHALQALAVRDKKVYVVRAPEIPAKTTRVYLDVEGIPDRDFYYLVGVVVETDGQCSAHSFWADNETEEQAIWVKLLDLLRVLGDCTLFHYGAYEKAYIKKMLRKYPSPDTPFPGTLDSALFNVLGAIRTNVYFPAYSNGLKDIASFLGVTWTGKVTSGIDCIAARMRWEESKDSVIKEEIVDYNRQDCLAVQRVADFLLSLGSPEATATPLVQLASEIKLCAVYFRVAGANNSIVRDARVLLASHWSRWRPTMRPYSMDLRERVAAAIDAGEGSQRQVAKRFRVSVSFVTRLVQRRRDAGTLAPKPHGGGPRPALGFPERVRLAMRIAEHPDATLKQLKEWGGFACTLTTLWRTLRRFRLTYKKKTLHAGERDTPEVQAKRRRYRAKVRRIEAKRLVFVDETGVNTAMTPTHAWARRGERAKGSVPSSWGSTTVIAALGLDGVRAPLVFPGATDTQAFQTYVDQVLVPELRPGDVVVFDNLKPHLSRHVAESIERAGATVLPLPPYSSDYDPIEELWSKFKGQLRRIAARTKDGLYKAVGETLDSVTIQDILGWFNHSGLYATHG